MYRILGVSGSYCLMLATSSKSNNLVSFLAHLNGSEEISPSPPVRYGDCMSMEERARENRDEVMDP